MPSSTSLAVGGLTPLSSVDWPGELAAVVFLQGCPWDCAYCHNPHLLPASGGEDAGDAVAWDDVLAFLDARRGLLDGVVFSGGEPLAQRDLAAAIAEVRARGFKVGLHTSGVVPARFAEVLPLVDWVGFDAKAPWDAYASVTGVAGSDERARESLAALAASGVAYEVRTTVHPDLLGEAELLALAAQLRAAGVTRWAVQGYRPDGARPGLAAASVRAVDLPAGLGEGFASFEVRPSSQA